MGWGVGQAACQVVMDAGRAGAFLMLTQAGKQMVFQPEGNFQGVALPQLPRPLHTGPAGLSFLFKAGATGLGKGMGRGRWRLGQVVCVLGPEKLWGPAWSLPKSPPLLASPALRSTPPLCPALTQPCHFRPEPNWGLTWPSSKAASRVSFLSHRADHITPDSGIEFRFRIKYELFSPKFDALHNSSLLMLLPRTTLPTRPGKTLAVPLKSHVLSRLYTFALVGLPPKMPFCFPCAFKCLPML